MLSPLFPSAASAVSSTKTARRRLRSSDSSNGKSCSSSSSSSMTRFLSVLALATLSSTTSQTEAFSLTTVAAAPSRTAAASSALHYASSATMSPAPTPSLQDLLQATEKKTTTPKKNADPLAAHIKQVRTLDEYNQLLNEQQRQAAQSSKSAPIITVVRFHATFCSACKRATPAFHRLVKKHVVMSSTTSSSNNNNNNNNIQFVDVAISKDNADLQKHVGLKTIPFGFIHHPAAAGGAGGGGGIVEGLKVNTRGLKKLEQTLDYYRKGECPVIYQSASAS